MMMLLEIIIVKIIGLIPNKLYLQLLFFYHIGHWINFKNPQTFNEKLQRLKLYDHNPEYTKMVDKYLAKKYVSDIIGEEYIIPTLGIYDSFDEIDFDRLPNEFVLKCTHDSGTVVICKDKKNFNKQAAMNKINGRLKFNYYNYSRERPYKNIKPRIIAEKYMLDSKGDDLTDYKFMCFNGKMKCSFTCTERFSDKGLKVTFFDKDRNVMPFERHYPKSKKEIKKPKNYEKMIELAEKLSKNISFVRVDLYEINGKIYFGELTFYPGSGFEEFSPIEWDYKLGSWIDLPNKFTIK